MMRRYEQRTAQSAEASAMDSRTYLKVFGAIGGFAVVLGVILFVVTVVLPRRSDEDDSSPPVPPEESAPPSEPRVYQPRTRLFDLPSDDAPEDQEPEAPAEVSAPRPSEPREPEPEQLPGPVTESPEVADVVRPRPRPAVVETGKEPEAPPANIEIPDVAGGTVVIQRDILPIQTNQTRLDVQRYLQLTRLHVCDTCGGSGKVKDRGTVGQRRQGIVVRPVTNTWHKICPECSCEAQGCDATCPLRKKGDHTSCERCCGAGAACRALRFYSHCCGHCCPPHSERIPCQRGCCRRESREPTCSDCATCADLRALRASHAAGGGVCDYCRRSLSCREMRPGHGALFHVKAAENLVSLVGSLGHVERDQQFPRLRQAASARLRLLFESRVWRHFGPISRRVWGEEPAGQPVIVRGELSRAEGPPGSLIFFKVGATGSRDSALVMAYETDKMPLSQELVLGGLMVGRWTQAKYHGRGGTPVILAVVCAPRT